MPKMEIHLEISVPGSSVGVNQVIALFEQVQEQLGQEMARCYLEQAQDQQLDEALGTRWQDEAQEEAPWSCPECHATKGFNRRGSRRRVLRKTSLGRIEFQLQQVTCRHCGRTFSPFPDLLDLEPYQASTTEFQVKAVEVACQTSYARAARYLTKLAGVTVSPTAIHRWVQAQGSQVVFDAAVADGRVTILDSTKVPAGDKERGALLNVGVAIRKRYSEHNRPRLMLAPVCLGVGESWKETGQDLEPMTPDRVVFDGDEDIRHWAEQRLPETPKQRGTWHLVNQLYWPLWRDGLRKQGSDPWLRRLGRILYHSESDLEQTKKKLQDLINDLSEAGLHEGARYLAAAAPYAFLYREVPDGIFSDSREDQPFAIMATSPVERQMREINRRTDVGARWSIPGVRNIIALDLCRRLDAHQWRDLWQRPTHVSPEYSVVNLQISVQAGA